MFSSSPKLSTTVLRQTRRFKSCLVISEHNDKTVDPITQSALSAAKKLRSEISVLVAGTDCKALARELAKAEGVRKVIVSQGPEFRGFLGESLTPLVLDCHRKYKYSHILSGASLFGKSLLPRIAAKLDVSPATDVVGIKSPDTFVRQLYSGRARQTVRLKDDVKVLTVRGISFEAASLKGGGAKIEEVSSPQFASSKSRFVKAELLECNRPKLTSARVVVSGGRGLKSREKFKLVYALADALDAAVGCTRGAADAGFVNHEFQIGQSGKYVAPDLYIAVGISGAVQHVTGMRDSRTIVAIDQNKDAPIFQVADYGLVGDLFKIVPEIISKLESTKAVDK